MADIPPFDADILTQSRVVAGARQWRFGLFGLGRIGIGYDIGAPPDRTARSHAGAIAGDARFRLVAASDPAPAARSAAAEFRPAADLFSNASELLERHRLDVAAIAAPSQEHRELVMQCLEAGVRVVFCEKPLGSTLQEAADMVSCARSAGAHLLVNYHRRWDPRFRLLRERVAASGPPLRTFGLYRNGLVNYGSHLVDLLLMLHGRCREVRGLQVGSATGDPSPSFMLRFDSGTEAWIHGLDGAAYELLELGLFYPDRLFRLEMGGFTIDEREMVTDVHYPGYESLTLRRPPLATGPVGGLREAYDEVAALLEGVVREPSSGGPNALAVWTVIEAIRASLDHGQTVRL